MTAGELPGEELSSGAVIPPPVTPGKSDDEVTLSEAVKATGVTDRTLRRWLSKGDVKGRQVESPYGEQWLVPLSAVQEIAVRKGLGHARSVVVTPVVNGALTPVSADEVGQAGPGVTPLTTEWQRVMAQMANVVDLAGELGETKEAKGRAEMKAEHLKEKLGEERSKYEGKLARERERVEQLEAELQAAQEAAQRKRGWFRRRK
jgi:DNA-binding transcriptional MerR regulator